VSRDCAQYLGDIADACRLIDEFTAGMSGESFAGNALAFQATVRNLEIVGEAAKRPSLRSFQRHFPEALVKVEKLDDFLGRARKVARLADAGKPIPDSFVSGFEDPADMLAVLTPARLALFRAIKKARDRSHRSRRR
jgi:uncharacterized protein with HEPN domain